MPSTLDEATPRALDDYEVTDLRGAHRDTYAARVLSGFRRNEDALNIQSVLLGEKQGEAGGTNEVRTLGGRYVVDSASASAPSRDVALYYVPNAIMTWPSYSVIYGVNMIFLAFGSFAFHAHNTKFTHRLDIIGMYLVVIPFALYDIVFLCVPGFLQLSSFLTGLTLYASASSSGVNSGSTSSDGIASDVRKLASESRSEERRFTVAKLLVTLAIVITLGLLLTQDRTQLLAFGAGDTIWYSIYLFIVFILLKIWKSPSADLVELCLHSSHNDGNAHRHTRAETMQATGSKRRLGAGVAVWGVRFTPIFIPLILFLLVAALVCQEQVVRDHHKDHPLPCNQHNKFFQFHGTWHMICGLALFLVYCWQRSEYKALLFNRGAGR